MNTALWVIQIVLAVAFLAAGVLKLSQPREKLEQSLPWTTDFSTGTIRLIGTSEGLAALGLVLPAALGIAPVLTPLAAVGLALVMIGAVVTHARRKEPQAIVVNVVILALAVVVAWGRFGAYAF